MIPGFSRSISLSPCLCASVANPETMRNRPGSYLLYAFVDSAMMISMGSHNVLRFVFGPVFCNHNKKDHSKGREA